VQMAPYTHDGSGGTLAQVIDFYDRGDVTNVSVPESLPE